MPHPVPPRLPIFDFDGTLLDSDAALAAAFAAVGVAAEDITYGHVPSDECRRLGIDLAEFLAAYDPAGAQPYPGVADLVTGLGRWAICSNKEGGPARAEIARLGWQPAVALFSGDFGGPKQLAPILAALGIAASEAFFIGDTDHDRRCAEEAGVPFALAAWNPRANAARADAVLRHPGDLRALLTG